MSCIEELGRGMMADLRTMTDLGICDESCETGTRMKCSEYDRLVGD